MLIFGFEFNFRNMKVEGSDREPTSRHPPMLDDGDFAVDNKGVTSVPSSSAQSTSSGAALVPPPGSDNGANGFQPSPAEGAGDSDASSMGGHGGPASVDSGLGLGHGGGNGSFNLLNASSSSAGMILPDVNVSSSSAGFFDNGNLFQVLLPRRETKIVDI